MPDEARARLEAMSSSELVLDALFLSDPHSSSPRSDDVLGLAEDSLELLWAASTAAEGLDPDAIPDALTRVRFLVTAARELARREQRASAEG